MDESDPEMMMDDENVDFVDSDDEEGMLTFEDNKEVENELPKVGNIPKIDSEAWKEEVERLAPQLKVKNHFFNFGQKFFSLGLILTIF